MMWNGEGTPIVAYDYIGARSLLRALQNGIDLDLRSGSGTYYDYLTRPEEWRHKNSGGTTLIGFQHTYDRMGNKLNQRLDDGFNRIVSAQFQSSKDRHQHRLG